MSTPRKHPTGPTRLNDLQLHLLRVFERKLTKKQEAEVKKLVDEQVDDLLATGKVNLAELEHVGEESDRSKLKPLPKTLRIGGRSSASQARSGQDLF